MNQLFEHALKNAKTIVILGHLHPDGDCVGSTLGLYNYLTAQYPEQEIDLYLDHPPLKFSYLKNFDCIHCEYEEGKSYDLCITCDSSDLERLGVFLPYFHGAKDSFCIDHHVTNRGFAAHNCVKPNASSACEVLYSLLDEDAIDLSVAECLYTGIVHDTGVFKFSCTSGKTMEIAGKLMDKGIDCTEIIDGSFYRKTYVQNQILGRALLESVLFMDGKCVFSAVRKKEMDFYGVTGQELDGIIDQLRLTEGVEVAIFLYETGVCEFKVSLRSCHYVDVSRIAAYYGGGGHVRAAGCTMSGSIHDVLNNLAVHIEKQIHTWEAEHGCFTE